MPYVSSHSVADAASLESAGSAVPASAPGQQRTEDGGSGAEGDAQASGERTHGHAHRRTRTRARQHGVRVARPPMHALPPPRAGIGFPPMAAAGIAPQCPSYLWRCSFDVIIKGTPPQILINASKMTIRRTRHSFSSRGRARARARRPAPCRCTRSRVAAPLLPAQLHIPGGSIELGRVHVPARGAARGTCAEDLQPASGPRGSGPGFRRSSEWACPRPRGDAAAGAGRGERRVHRDGI